MCAGPRAASPSLCPAAAASAGVPLNSGADLDRVAPADGLEDLAVAQDDDEGDGGDVVVLRDVGEFFGVDAEEGDGRRV